MEEQQVPAGIAGVHGEQEDEQGKELEEIAGEHEEEKEEIAGVHEDEKAEMAGGHKYVQENNEGNWAPEDQDNVEAQQQLENAMNTKYGPRSGHYNLRNRRQHDYLHLFVMSNAHSKDSRSHAKRSANQETRRKSVGAKCGSVQ